MMNDEDKENIEYLTNLLKNAINDKKEMKKILTNVVAEIEESDMDFFTKFYNIEIRILYYAFKKILDELNIKITNMFYMTGTKERFQHNISLNLNNNKFSNHFMLNNTFAPLFALSIFLIELEYKNKIYLFNIMKYEDILIVLSMNKYPFSLFYWVNDIYNSDQYSFNDNLETLHDKILGEILYSPTFQGYVFDNLQDIMNNDDPIFEELSILSPKETLYIRQRESVISNSNNKNEIDIKMNEDIKKIIPYAKKSYLIDNETILFGFIPIKNDAEMNNFIFNFDMNNEEMFDTLMKKVFVRNVFIKKDSELYNLIYEKTNEYLGYTSYYLEKCDKRLDSLVLKIKMKKDLNIYDSYFKVDIKELETEYLNQK